MKTIGLVLVVAVTIFTVQAALTEEQKKTFKKFYDECVTESGADKELIAKARKGEFADNDKLAHYFDCMSKKIGFQDADGKLHAEVLISKLPETVDKIKGEEIVKKCVNVDATVTKQKIAYTIFKCFITSVGKEVKFF